MFNKDKVPHQRIQKKPKKRKDPTNLWLKLDLISPEGSNVKDKPQDLLPNLKTNEYQKSATLFK